MYPNRHNLPALVSAFVCCAILVACSGEPKMDNRLITTYASVLVVRESTVDSTLAKQRYDSVLKVNGYTTESFESALREQSEDREHFKAFYDSVVARVKTQRMK